MILSDRVSGKLSVRGIFVASVLALAALPGWSFAQKPAAAPAGESAQLQPDRSATAARLEQIEAELKRLAALVEHKERPDEPKPAQGERGQREKPSLCAKYKAVANNTAATFESGAHKYTAAALEQAIHFDASDKDGRVIWRGYRFGTLPARLSGGHWALQESDDQKQVIFTWTAIGNEHIFRLDAGTGKLLSHDVRRVAEDASAGLPGGQATPHSQAARKSEPIDSRFRRNSPANGQSPAEMHDDERLARFYSRLSGLGYFKNENPPASRSVKKLQPSLTFATGENRIYILSIAKSAEGQCFLSAQTNQAEQVWRSTFPNPLGTYEFQKAWTERRNGPPPDDVLASTWTVQESGDRKLLVVGWSGKGVDLRIRFDAESGKFLGCERMPDPGPVQSPPAKGR